MPCGFTVIFEVDDERRFRPRHLKGATDLSKWRNREDVLLILRFSKPKRTDGSYRAREVWIRHDQVAEKRAYNYWD